MTRLGQLHAAHYAGDVLGGRIETTSYNFMLLPGFWVAIALDKQYVQQ